MVPLLAALMHGTAACQTDGDCLLLGSCEVGTCKCRQGFTGPECGQIDVAAAPTTLGYHNLSASTWGGLPPSVQGKWHMHVSMMAGDCPLGTFNNNSFIAHVRQLGRTVHIHQQGYRPVRPQRRTAVVARRLRGHLVHRLRRRRRSNQLPEWRGPRELRRLVSFPSTVRFLAEIASTCDWMISWVMVAWNWFQLHHAIGGVVPKPLSIAVHNGASEQSATTNTSFRVIWSNWRRTCERRLSDSSDFANHSVHTILK